INQGYIQKNKKCPVCINEAMKIVNNNKVKSWRCPKCYKKISLLKDTILYNCKKNLTEIIDIIYFWSLDTLQTITAREVNCGGNDTIYKYYKKLSLQSYHILKLLGRNKIGGLGHVVEIDESKFSKRKYNVGRLIRSPWIVGGIDLTTNQIFF
ncbi:hypothetical protein H311_05062, partial [Anncaliia algerae PRA109]